jgi:Putative zinc-finger
MNPISRYLADRLACRDVARLVSQLQERPPTLSERVVLHFHLAACAACAGFDRQMTFLRKAMQRYRA